MLTPGTNTREQHWTLLSRSPKVIDVAALIYAAGGKGRERDKVDAVAAARAATTPSNNAGASDDARSLMIHVSKMEPSAAIQRQSPGVGYSLTAFGKARPRA